MNKIISLVNYELKLTLTLLDECTCAKNLIDLIFIRSPHRTDDVTMANLGETKLDRIDKIDNQYIFDLRDYKHYLLVKPYEMRLKYFYENYVKGKEWYSVTNEDFPKKKVNTIEHVDEFVKEAYPENLNILLMPYEYIQGNLNQYLRIFHQTYKSDVDVFCKHLEVDPVYNKC